MIWLQYSFIKVNNMTVYILLKLFFRIISKVGLKLITVLAMSIFLVCLHLSMHMCRLLFMFLLSYTRT